VKSTDGSDDVIKGTDKGLGVGWASAFVRHRHDPSMTWHLIFKLHILLMVMKIGKSGFNIDCLRKVWCLLIKMNDR
jgi:hypothetical protein